MKQKKIEPAVSSAIDYINKSIDKKEIDSNGRLPGIRSLAAKAGVSVVTMWKALQVLREKGDLHGDGHRRYLVKGFEGKKEDSTSPVLSWERVRDALYKDLLNGVYVQGKPLPLIKEIQARYNTSYYPAKRALDWLLKKSALTYSKKRYTVPVHVRSQTKHRIAALTYSPDGQLQLLSFRTHELLREIEKNCMQINFNLDILTFSTFDEKLRFYNVRTKRDESFSDLNEVAGFIIISTGLIELYDRVVTTLSKMKKTIAVIDEGGNNADCLLKSRPSPYAVFQIAVSPIYGEQVAQYLLHLGHQNIAYISTYHETPWSINRFDGFKKVYTAAGLPDQVSIYIEERARHDSEFQEDLIQNYNMGSFLAQCDHLDSLFGRKFDHDLNTLRSQVLSRCVIVEIERQFEHLFEQILLNKKITAWVGGNDNVAVAALNFLYKKGISVPEEISVIGFDDRFDAYVNGLTTCNFNLSFVVHEIVDFILHSKRKPTRNPTHRVSNGMIIERGTCGIVRRFI